MTTLEIAKAYIQYAEEKAKKRVSVESYDGTVRIEWREHTGAWLICAHFAGSYPVVPA